MVIRVLFVTLHPCQNSEKIDANVTLDVLIHMSVQILILS